MDKVVAGSLGVSCVCILILMGLPGIGLVAGLCLLTILALETDKDEW
jgi:hypothetical protein